jgi:hypothetical protein
MAEQESNAVASNIITQSTFAQSPAAAGLDFSLEVIVCTPHTEIAEYQGTRAALEAEGVIPQGTKWPEGFEDLRWRDEKFKYWLRRIRPEGAKGPRKQFADFDWWMFRFDPINRKGPGELHVERKAKELADLIYRQSPKGRDEWSKQFDRYWKAKGDDKFQAFKALIPGAVAPSRGRKPRPVVQSAKSI